MNPKNFNKAAVKVTTSTYDPADFAKIRTDENGFNDCTCVEQMAATAELPIMYHVAVKVKIHFIWRTIWEADCDISDGDTRAAIERRAEEIRNLISADL